MRLLVYRWNELNDDVLVENLIKLGYEIVVFECACENYMIDMKFAFELMKQIEAEKIEGIVTFNYIPVISMVCDIKKTPYFAWIYDSPHNTLYAKSIFSDCNRVGNFDRALVKDLNLLGIQNVFHLPLAVDTEYFSRVWDNPKIAPADIAFVGKLYNDQWNYYDKLREEYKGDQAEVWDRTDALIDKQCFSWEENLLKREQMGEDMDYFLQLARQESLLFGEEFIAHDEDTVCKKIFDRKVTEIERQSLVQGITGLAERKGYDFKLYTSSSYDNRYNVGRSDYKTETPAVFHKSRINLNLTLRSIRTGIPLRVLDILGCGGFCLTNPQEEILEYFEVDKEIVVYNSLEECLDKIDYYLSHEEERSAIATRGFEKVKQRFNYKIGLEKLLNS